MAYQCKNIPDDALKALDEDWAAMAGGSLTGFGVRMAGIAVSKFGVEVSSDPRALLGWDAGGPYGLVRPALITRRLTVEFAVYAVKTI